MKLIKLRDSNHTNQKFNRCGWALVVLALGCFAISPRAQAVTPAPDGGYPGGNTAEGQNALFSLTSGGYNTAIGFFSLRSNATGQLNTAIGAGTLLVNTADQNTATGAVALLSNTTGTQNTANGAFALFGNSTGNNNNAFGFQALFSNTTGPFNNAFGDGALSANTTGDRNTAMGEGAMLANTTGSQNTAVGVSALRNNTTGFGNIAIGQDACSQSQGGQKNTGVGWAALVHNAGNFNTANGADALFNNTVGNNNTANGFNALADNTTGADNMASGAFALENSTTGSGNTALGVFAGSNVTTASNVICIGDEVSGANVSNSCFIGNIRGVTTANADAIPVLIDSAGQLGTTSSSRRFKKEIQPMDKASESLLALKPVTFHYKSDNTSTPQFGLIAEEVADINPDLVVRDEKGEIYTVRYEAVNAMLLNEFLKEHKKVEEQQATIAELKSTVAQQHKGFESKLAKQEKQIEALTAGLQKVSAQLELNRLTSQTVKNND
jgi:hypothetical protein